MKIESGANYLSAAQRAQATATKSDTSFQDLLAQETKKLSSPAANIKSKETDTYDFTHMSPSQLYDTVGGLIRSGKLNVDETSSLVGIMGASSPLSKVNYDGTANYTDAPVNVLAYLRAGVETAISRNEKSTAEGMQKAFDALSRLQGQTVDPKIQEISV
ncbi:hypothetical protein KH389_01465 [Pseudomonas qingdaonensis]|uniref:Filamentous hemagglutinin n=1 Tax=Pseudomonas qingdaonensis TaxID=2056231 RepID=A0ABX8DSS9_9PSED|nr:hypothetical protein [Pseudomonas qingdaonensis]MEC6744510.1 hypothetical protein [Pseudomonas qingdaonensis]QVL19279.1 hypothetical protein KH389_01465 [Pseudomonas qingdaonensis]